MMDILSALAQEQKKQSSFIPDDSNFATMHPDVFAAALERCGCAEDIIEDCLFEPRNLWDQLLKHYEKVNEK